MAEYEQIYNLNSTPPVEVPNNNLVVMPTLGLSATPTNNLIVAGIVYDENVLPINGALVVLYDPSTGQPIASDITRNIDGKDGSYLITFRGNNNVGYRITASYTGYDPYTDKVTFTNSQIEKVFFILKPNSLVRAIYGTVTDTSDSPIADALITVRTPSQVIFTQTTSDGSYVAYDTFTSGTTYNVQANKIGYLTNNKDITFPATSDFAQVNLTLTGDNKNYTTITGKVVIEGSNPPVGLANAFVGLYLYTPNASSKETLIKSMLTDSNGNYTFTNVNGNNQYIVKSNKVEQSDN